MKEIKEQEQLREFIEPTGFVFLIALAVSITFSLTKFILRYLSIRFSARNMPESRILTDWLRETVNDDRPRVMVIREDEIAIFCTYGKNIFVTTGLLDFVTIPELKAAILHEYGHANENHLVKSELTMSITSATLVAGIFQLGLFAVPVVGPVLTIVLSIVSARLGINILRIGKNLSLGKRHEYIADSYAVEYGYKNEIISLLKKIDKLTRHMICRKLKDKSSSACTALINRLHRLEEHPTTVQRVERLLKTYVGFALRTKNPEKASRSLDKFSNKFDAQIMPEIEEEMEDGVH